MIEPMTKDIALALAQDRLQAALPGTPLDIIIAIIEAIIPIIKGACPSPTPPTPAVMLRFVQSQQAAQQARRLTAGRLRVRAAIREAAGYGILDPRISETETGIWTVGSHSTPEELTALTATWVSSQDAETAE